MRLWSRVDSTANTAKKLSEHHFNKHVRHRSVFRPEDWVYVDELPLVKQGEAESAAKDLSRKLAPKKDNPLRIFKVKDHKLTVNVRGIHNVVSNDRVDLSLGSTRKPNQALKYYKRSKPMAAPTRKTFTIELWRRRSPAVIIGGDTCGWMPARGSNLVQGAIACLCARERHMETSGEISSTFN